MPTRYTYIITLLLSFSLFGCSGDKEPIPPQPGEAAIEFFDTIYNLHDLNLAVKRTTPQYSRILKSYQTAERVQKVLFNLRYDSVVIKEDKSVSGKSIFPNSAEKAEVTIMFDGLFQGNRQRDLKTVYMVKQQGKWLVNKLKADNFR